MYDFSRACDAPLIIRADISTLYRGGPYPEVRSILFMMNDETVIVLEGKEGNIFKYCWLVLDVNLKFVRQVRSRVNQQALESHVCPAGGTER